MRVIVLGSKGMLGHVVTRFLAESGHQVAPRSDRFDSSDPTPFLELIATDRPDAVVNCIGLKPGPGVTEAALDQVNALLPAVLAGAATGGWLFVHASTDGVFRADRPDRRTGEHGDAPDAYGRSKWTGESAVAAAGGHVIRASIVGPESGPPRGLLGWLSGRTGIVDGFTDHAWNGITTLEWARVCGDILDGRIGSAIVQPGFWPPSDKAELLRLAAKVWGLPVTVRPVRSGTPVLRTLVPDIACPPLGLQLAELRRWYGR